jgi:uncharacterized iron-regulated membrane protein
MFNLRRAFFWIHLTLGIVTGLVGALMAGTGLIMAFADSYLDAREYRSRHVAPPAGAEAISLSNLAAAVSAAHPGASVNRIGIVRNPGLAYEFYRDKDELDYVDPYSGKLRPSDSVPLRRTLHKGVEQWHRFLGFSGERRNTGKLVVSWVNVAVIPLLLTGLVLWWPANLHWNAIRAAVSPAGIGRGRGNSRSWHTALGFWALPFLLIMVVTALPHSFTSARDAAYRLNGASPPKPGAPDQLWAPGLSQRLVPANATLSLDQLRAIADREISQWNRLDIYPAPPSKPGGKTGSARLVALTRGWGPTFFPVVMQVDPYSGEILHTHSWDDLSAGTRLLAWSRWLHKGEAFGRTGQIVAGTACLVMLVLIYTGWALAIRRLMRDRKARQPVVSAII